MTSPTVISSSWKIEAASTASAPASNASFRCPGLAAPPEAITGTRTAARDRAGQLQVVARARTVAVPAGEQDLAGAAAGTRARPFERIDAGTFAPALDQHLEPAALARGVDRQHRALATEARRDVGQELRPVYRGRIDRDLVGAGLEQGARVVDRADAAADRERDAKARAHALYRLDLIAALFRGRRDIEDHDLVGALALVQGSALGRIAGVAQTLEADALDHAAVADVEAGDDARGQHHAASQRAISSCP